MDDKLLYWVWMTLCFPPGSRRMLQLLQRMRPEELYQNRNASSLPFLGPVDQSRIRGVSLEQAEKVLADCQRLKVDLVTMEDEGYPGRLLQTDSPPPVLYYQGSLEQLDASLTIGVVGTREAEEYYLRSTGNISFQLARAGVVIISGCAVGCDQYAHLGALKADGRTIGVLACGFGVNYPKETEDLRRAMLKRGALISELPPGTRNDKNYFRVRNRLISALSEGVLVTQAPVRSGALLTADHAVEQGKELFCLPPNDIYDAKCMGIAPLIRDGAQVVFSAWDILGAYLDRFGPVIDEEKLPGEDMTTRSGGRPAKAPPKEGTPPPSEVRQEVRPVPEDLAPEMREILSLLGKEPVQVEELLGKVEMVPYELLAVLTELELRGLARSLSGQRYQRI